MTSAVIKHFLSLAMTANSFSQELGSQRLLVNLCFQTPATLAEAKFKLWLNLSLHHICPPSSTILTSLHPDSSSNRPMRILPSWMSVNRSCTSTGGSRWGEKAWPSLITTFFSEWSDELICALLSAETHSSTWWRFSSALLCVHLRKRKQGLGTPIFK